MRCIVHCHTSENTGPLKLFERKSLESAENTAKRWLELAAKQQDLCQQTQVARSERQFWETHHHWADVLGKVGYHQPCFNYFVNEVLIGEAQHKLSVLGSQTEPQSQPVDTDDSPVKVPRTDVCIICNRQTRFFRQTGVTRRDALVEKKETEKLLLAARSDKSECGTRITAALQPGYMFQCHSKEYKDYVQRHGRHGMSTPTGSRHQTSSLKSKFDEAFKQFCNSILEPEVLERKKATKISTLLRKFKQCLKEKGVQHSRYRSWSLKKRLEKKYPNLIFTKGRGGKDQYVFMEPDYFSEVPTSTFVAETETETDTTDQNLTPMKSSSGQLSQTPSLPTVPEDPGDRAYLTETDTAVTPVKEQPSTSTSTHGWGSSLQVLYEAAMMIKGDLRTAPKMKPTWPPTVNDFDVTMAERIVPVTLYNTVAWICGLSEEPTLSEFVPVKAKDHVRLLSLLQDFLRLQKQDIFTPKALSLALTVKHWTGSARLVHLLNRLGHCVSNETVRSLETALALVQVDEQSNPTLRLTKSAHTILIFDNLDFKEETLTGHGQTHFTNGIAIQYEDELAAEEGVRPPTVSRKKRTFTGTAPSLEQHERQKRQGPRTFVDRADDFPMNEGVEFSSSRCDIVYEMMKTVDQGHVTGLPAWTGYNTLLNAKEPLVQSQITYLPIIDGNPTQMDTIATILSRSLKIADNLQLEHMTLVFDLAIYCKVQEVRWSNSEYQRRFVVRLGEFHQSMSFLGIIGKRFRDAGLQDLLVESGLVALGSVNGVLNGHHYNRSMRCHKILAEAMGRLRFSAFLDTMNRTERQDVEEKIKDLNDKFPSRLFREAEVSEETNLLLQKYNEFIVEGCTESKTFALWSSYIELVDLLKDFIRATRTADWIRHLQCTEFMVPWLLAYDHLNYGRYLPPYLHEMWDLSKTNPNVHQNFLEGKWTVQRHKNFGFSAMACDQTLEQTLNRDAKTSGGIKSFTVNRNAVQRWILAQPGRAEISRKCEELAGIRDVENERKDLQKSFVKKWEQQTTDAAETISQFVDPFSSGHVDMVNICSGVVATEKCSEKMLNAYKEGKIEYQKFLNDRLYSEKTAFNDPMKKLTLETFSSKESRSRKQEVAKISDRVLFSRLLLVAGQREGTDLRDVLSHSLGPVSFPLASTDGGLATTPKAKLRQHLLKKWPDCTTEAVSEGALIVDGMAIVQSIRIGELTKTFGELADKLLQIVLAKGRRHQRVDIVFDNYPIVSINAFTHQRRGASGQLRRILSSDQAIPKQWRGFLQNATNKINLIEFLCTQWRDGHGASLGEKILYVSYGEVCFRISRNGSQLVPELENDHEEADTRILLHAAAAATEYPYVTIYCADTDVFIMSLSCANSISAQIYQVLPSNSSRSPSINVDITKLAHCIGPSVCDALVGFHCVTGCDSVSSFSSKGKVKPFAIMTGNSKFIELMSNIGKEFELRPDDIKVAEEFVSKMYGQSHSSVDEARYKVFITKSFGESKLPPTRDALSFHLQRANYQAAIHRRCMDNKIDAPSPAGHGWMLTGDVIKVKWMSKPEAPSYLVNLTKCSCKKGHCESKTCSCVKNSFSCTDICACVNCSNTDSTQSEEDLLNDVSDMDSHSDSDS